MHGKMGHFTPKMGPKRLKNATFPSVCKAISSEIQPHFETTKGGVADPSGLA
jgi:hypothetical protein